jgi:hypothetical protein
LVYNEQVTNFAKYFEGKSVRYANILTETIDIMLDFGEQL